MFRLLLTLLLCLFLCTSATAQGQASKIPGLSDIRTFADEARRDIQRAGETLTIEELQEIYDVFMEEFANYIIASMESVPEKYWQYLVPYFYASEGGFPQKVLEYPRFVPYKGAKPKDIEPRMQAFADKHLDHLHPLLYIVLIPEEDSGERREQMTDAEVKAYIRSFPQEHEARLPDSPPPRNPVIANISETVPFEHYASGRYLEDKPDTERSKAITDESGLKGGDVLGFARTVKKVAEVGREDYDAKYRKPLTKDEYIDRLRVLEQKDTSAAPCRFFVDGLEEENRIKLAAAVREQGFSTDEWTAVCDRSIKALRLARLNLHNVNGIAEISRTKRQLLANPALTDEAKELIRKQMGTAENMYSGRLSDVPP